MTVQHERASKKQQELLRFVDAFIKGNGYGPSYREIMRSLGYKSVSTVAIHIDNLIAKGYLRRTDKSARSLEVVTLHADTAASSTHTRQWRDELKEHVAAAQLEPDQWHTVAEAFALLNLSDAVPKSAKEGDG